MTTPHWLEITEYISLATATLGTIAATATQQIAVGLTPITLTIALNLINRQRISQLNQQHKESEALQIASLNERFNQLEINSQQINLKTQQKLTQHQNSIDKMESLTQLLENLESLSQQINSQNQQQFEALKQTIVSVQTELKNLTPKQQIVKLEDTIALLHQRLGQLEEQNQQINPQIQEQLAEIKKTIALLHQRLGQLEEQNQQINPQIQEQLAEIKEAIAPIITLTKKITYLEQISQKINARMIESAQNFNNQIDSVNQRLENLEINEQEINPQIQQQFAEIKYAISHIDNIYDFFAKLKKQETENQSPPSVQTQYRKERIFQQEEKTNIGEDNQTKSNQKTSETEKPQTPKSPVPNIVKNEIEQTIETAKNDIQQGKREIEEEVKKLGESLNNLFKP